MIEVDNTEKIKRFVGIRTSEQLKEVGKITANLTQKKYRTAFTHSSTGNMAKSVEVKRNKSGVLGSVVGVSVYVDTKYAAPREFGWNLKNGIKRRGPKFLMRNFFGAVKRVSKGGKWEKGFKG